jgi:hypothetical protein
MTAQANESILNLVAIMKIVTSLLLLPFLAGLAAAGPLQTRHVSADAKWVVHLDVEKLLTTQLGSYVARTFVDKKFAKATRDLEQWGIDFDWRDIESITAYGTDFASGADQRGVLLLKGSFDVPGALDVVIERLASAGNTDLERIQSEPYPIYAAKGGLFGAPSGKDLFLVSKSRSVLEQARRVAGGGAASLTEARSFPAIDKSDDGFLLAAVADGFQSAAKLPPQVNGLKNAESGQVVAGEKADKVFVNLALNTRDAESATQMQQVFQGLLALAALTQEQNKELAALVQGARVGGTERMVTVNVELPSETVIAKVGEKKPGRKK